MEFSWQYSNTMQSLITSTRSERATYSDSINRNETFPRFLTFEINREGCEVPTGRRRQALTYMSRFTEPTTIVVPLSLCPYPQTYAGAETILKAFARSGANDNLKKIVTTKGEVYYGDYGMILDKDFNPLLFSTIRLTSGGMDLNRGVIVHIHPKVFTDTEGMLNKSILKKGIGFYLQQGRTDIYTSLPISVQIDDSSAFFRAVHKPNVNNFSPKETKKLLRENIDDILNQIVFDNALYIR